jgi:Tfp pilus tip-associated adhesin PilY1
MTRPIRTALSIALAASLAFVPARDGSAEDIDLFITAGNSADKPNILVILDSSANWSAANQGWAGGLKQGQSELRALRQVLDEIRPTAAEVAANGSGFHKVRMGLMMMETGAGVFQGGYIRFDVRSMTQANVDAFKELIGDPAVSKATCEAVNSGLNSVTGSPNCIYHNFDDNFEKAPNAEYTGALFEAFKYFGGYTDVAHANTVPKVAGVPPAGAVDPHTFGRTRRAGAAFPNASDQTGNAYRKFDANAFTGSTKATYKSDAVIRSTAACAKNYIIFIGNGFPTSEPTAFDTELLTNVNQPATQLTMPQFVTTSTTTTTSTSVNEVGGAFCGTGNNANNRKSDCEANAISAAFKAANYADTYTCVNPQVNTAPCNGANKAKFDVQMAKAVFTVTPTGTFATPTSAKTRYTDEMAKFIATTDVNEFDGQQTISTYTIDVFKDQQDSDQTALLMSMARYGGGKYFSATSEDAIVSALRNIMIEIQSVNTVFASASLPINATNRSQNENQVFIGMFRPSSGGRPRWFGNLKRYQIGLFGGDAKLADADGIEAVGPNGFVAPCARSFWTSDTGAYWDFSTYPGVASFAGICTTNAVTGTRLFSDLPDGSQVEKGAVAHVLRMGNNPPTGTPFTYANTSTTPTPTTASTTYRNIYTCLNANTTTTFDNSLVTCNTGVTAMHTFNNVAIALPAALGAADTTERDRIINFTIGADFASDAANLNNNECPAGTGCITDVRPDIHGDVAHSRPLPVNYGGSTGVVLYYGANDGTFRAVSGSSGKELWSFIAPEHHARLKRMRDNAPQIKFYGSTDPTLVAKDYFFDGSAGIFQTFDPSNVTDKVWIYPTMRRGGRMLYAFDAISTTAPRMKWRKGCPNLTNDTGCTTGFEAIGQTWSIPSVAFVRGYSSTAPVIITGGGYDACEDGNGTTYASISCGSTKGNRVFVLDADTGTIVKTFTTDRAVASDVTLVDLDFDGKADHAYVLDTGGNLYRINFINPPTHPTAPSATLTSTDWTIVKIARTNVVDAGRKFLFAPAALPASGKVFLAFSSGDRERPLITNYPYTTTDLPTSGQLGIKNRAYMFQDLFPYTAGSPSAAVNLDDTTVMNDFTTDTGCTQTMASGTSGWFFDLVAGRGEQGVTSTTIFGGLIFFSTNRPLDSAAVSCSNDLGEARGYAVNLLNASGAVGTEALCGGLRSNTFLGGGLPPSPVTGTVPVGGKPVTVMIGGVDRSGGQSSPIGAQKVKPTISQRRSRIYWYRHGDK